jgi:hypothetical protein
MTRNIFKSSTESRNLEKGILAHKSLIKVFKNRDKNGALWHSWQHWKECGRLP